VAVGRREETKGQAVRFYYCITPEHETPLPPLDDMQTVEAPDAMQAIAWLAKNGKLPVIGDTFWVRIVVESKGGGPTKAISMPLTPEFQVPLDWQPPDE
jgi:hypothetical protein